METPLSLEARMSRLVRMDQSGHTVLAQWSPDDLAGAQAARSAMHTELARGYIAVATQPGGVATAVRELPLGADLVILRRPIAGG